VLLEANSVEIAKSALKRIMPHLGNKARELDVARQLLPKNATENVKFRIKERRRMRIATQQQAAAIERAMLPRYKLLVRTAFATSCRWGEVVALRGTDVEKRGSGCAVKIQRTVEEVGRDCTERGYGKTETAMRDITVPADLARELAAFGRELCFLGPRGGYLKRSTFRRVFWLPAIEKAGIPGLRVHDMRHSAISWRANSGIPLAAVRDRAGHSRSRRTSRLAWSSASLAR
jgi:integrase